MGTKYSRKPIILTLDSDSIGCMFGVLPVSFASVSGFLLLLRLLNQSLGSTSGWRDAELVAPTKFPEGLATAVS
jgi:hypothetical protein